MESDEGEPLISIESSAEVVAVVDLDPDKTEAGPSIDMESDARLSISEAFTMQKK